MLVAVISIKHWKTFIQMVFFLSFWHFTNENIWLEQIQKCWIYTQLSFEINYSSLLFMNLTYWNRWFSGAYRTVCERLSTKMLNSKILSLEFCVRLMNNTWWMNSVKFDVSTPSYPNSTANNYWSITHKMRIQTRLNSQM